MDRYGRDESSWFSKPGHQYGVPSINMPIVFRLSLAQDSRPGAWSFRYSGTPNVGSKPNWERGVGDRLKSIRHKFLKFWVPKTTGRKILVDKSHISSPPIKPSRARDTMPKATTPTAARQGRRHNPLEEDVIATGLLRTKASKRKSKNSDADEGDEEHFVDAKASKNILRIGRELADEEDAARAGASKQQTAPDTFAYDSRFDEEDQEAGGQVYGEDDEVWGDEDEVVEEIEVDPNDLETYRKFMRDEEADDLLKHGWDRKPSGEGEEEGEAVNLADLILEKIAAHEAAETRQAAGLPEDNYELPPKVVEVYTK